MAQVTSGGGYHWQDGLENGNILHSHSSGLSSHGTPASAHSYLSPSMLAALRDNHALQGSMPYMQSHGSDHSFLTHQLAASHLQSMPDGHMHGHDLRPEFQLGYGHMSSQSQAPQAFPLEDGHYGASPGSVQDDGLSEDHLSNLDRRQSKKTEMNRKAQQRYR